VKSFRTTLRYALIALCLFTAGAGSAQNDPITLTAFFSDPNANWANMQDHVGRYLTEKTGVTIQPEFAVGDPGQKINLIAASGQYPCLISPKGSANVLVDAGAMLELTDLIEEHGPNIRKVMGDQFERLRFSSDDPGIYFIPTLETIGHTHFDTDAWFKLQLAALEEQGYPEVRTLEDFEAVIANYVAAHPTTEDGQPTIGLSLLADDWRIVISVTNPAFWATGASDDGEWYIDPVTYEAIPHYFRPEEREYFRWLNHMNDIGLLDPESFTQKYDQYLAKIASGRVVGLIDAGWEIADAINSLRAAGKEDKAYARFGVTLEPDMKAAYNTPTGFTGGWGIGITESCPDPVRAIQFLDYLASDEGQVLINWGIEGQHYEVVDGKRVFTEEYEAMRVNDRNTFQRTTGIGNYNMSVRYGDGVLDPTGNYYTTTFPEQILQTYSDAERRALAAYGATFWNDLLPPASEFEPKEWGAAWSINVPQESPLSEFWTREQDIVRRYIPRAILAEPEEFDAIYDQMLSDMERQLGQYSELQTELVKDRLRLWGVLY
jgi:putative aldouronate transport system substrate-binding protein